MPLKKIPLPPGFDKNDTASQAEGRWIDGDNVRFQYGSPEKIGKVWVRDKKTALYYFPIKSLCDLSILNPTYIPSETQAHTYFYSHHTDYPKVNKLIPISKHYQNANIFIIKFVV